MEKAFLPDTPTRCHSCAILFRRQTGDVLRERCRLQLPMHEECPDFFPRRDGGYAPVYVIFED